ncbi:MAG: lectin, partial [Betaproteobacteria bacterium]
MKTKTRVSLVALLLIAAASQSAITHAAADKKMSFFVTSSSPGKGADLGGLSGADKHCQSLALAAGAGKRTWHAYLSNSATASHPAINARDRIGQGPWYNAKGVLIAHNVDELHQDNNLTKQTALTEKGEITNGRGDTPNA